MTVTLLCESGGQLSAREGGKWSATLLTPGVGSSGTYTEQMLAECGPTAFPAGTKLWWGHPKEGEGPGDRDARDQWGYLEEDATFEPGEGLVGKIVVLPHWREVVDSLGSQASLSIYAMGEHDKEGNVTALLEHMTNSVDIVGYPGRPGSGLKNKIEAARGGFTKPGSTSAPGTHHQQEEGHMDPEQLKALVKTVVDEALKPINTFLANEDARRQAEADAADGKGDVKDAVEAAITTVEAIKAAKVLPSFEAKLIEDAKKGVDVTGDLEFAKKVTAEAVAPAAGDDSASGYFYESVTAGDDFSLNLGGRF